MTCECHAGGASKASPAPGRSRERLRRELEELGLEVEGLRQQRVALEHRLQEDARDRDELGILILCCIYQILSKCK
jgi:hypothetical protein